MLASVVRVPFWADVVLSRFHTARLAMLHSNHPVPCLLALFLHRCQRYLLLPLLFHFGRRTSFSPSHSQAGYATFEPHCPLSPGLVPPSLPEVLPPTFVVPFWNDTALSHFRTTRLVMLHSTRPVPCKLARSLHCCRWWLLPPNNPYFVFKKRRCKKKCKHLEHCAEKKKERG